MSLSHSLSLSFSFSFAGGCRRASGHIRNKSWLRYTRLEGGKQIGLIPRAPGSLNTSFPNGGNSGDNVAFDFIEPHGRTTTTTNPPSSSARFQLPLCDTRSLPFSPVHLPPSRRSSPPLRLLSAKALFHPLRALCSANIHIIK